jgi:O-antigen ligase
MCYLVLNLVDSRERVFQVFRVLTLSTFLVACYGFYQFAIQDYGALFWIVNPRLESSLVPNRVAFWEWRNRIISVLTSELELAHYFNLCIPVGVALWLTIGRGRIGSKWLLMTVAMLVGLLLTFTFGAWLALAATVACFALLLDKKRFWKPMLVAMLVLALVVSVLVYGPLRPSVEAKALGTGVGSLSFDVVARLDSWLFALQVWRSHPLLGVGVGSFEQLEYANESIHSEWVQIGSTPQNAYLYLLADSGVIGLVAVLVILLGTIRTNLKTRRDPGLGMMAWVLAFALTTTMFASLTDDGPLFGPHAAYLVWLLVGLSETIWNLVKTEQIRNVAFGGVR